VISRKYIALPSLEPRILEKDFYLSKNFFNRITKLEKNKKQNAMANKNSLNLFLKDDWRF
jgi:hypothetical protein